VLDLDGEGGLSPFEPSITNSMPCSTSKPRSTEGSASERARDGQPAPAPRPSPSQSPKAQRTSAGRIRTPERAPA
jgi:hypothetical protein